MKRLSGVLKQVPLEGSDDGLNRLISGGPRDMSSARFRLFGRASPVLQSSELISVTDLAIR